MTLSNEVAVVTGGGRGIGRAIALALAAEGAKVAVLARSRDELEETAALAGDAAPRVLAVPADVTDEAAVADAVARVHDRFGPTTLLVNNAAVYTPDEPPLWEADLGAWWRDVESNVRGPLVCIRAFLPTMVAEGRGRIVTLGSDSGVLPYPLTSYSFGKSALVRLTETLGVSLDRAGSPVRTFAISPGAVNTRLTATFAAKFPDMDWTPAEHSGRLVTALASGRYDALHGRYLSVDHDLDVLLERLEEVRKEELLVQRMRVYGRDGAITTDWE
ncbi:SDR family oxidoreductase [Streptomyces sp. NPDC089799]|uniref:SDR family NAD(P)-dependent oxidoreductase n=1 Tax=Streptomyces sp. NPDC089799 TaxID=3155066 RepID=UPI0034475BF5